MNRWNFRISLLLTLLFLVVFILMRARPYDQQQDLQPFMQNRCTAACFAGIQPGVTSVDEALVRLDDSGWTREIDNRTINNVSGYISWKWSDQKPDWISREMDGEIWATQKQVIQIMIYGDLQLGASRLALGLPDQETIERTADRKGIYTLYTAAYAQAGLMIQSWQPCRVIEPLRRPVILTYTLPANPNIFPARDALTDLYHACAYPRP